MITAIPGLAVIIAGLAVQQMNRRREEEEKQARQEWKRDHCSKGEHFLDEYGWCSACEEWI